ncbi:MAG TPA: NAD(P)-binding domain-containing protein, partial [Candidatus Limnocylindrales bacterium]|nr:NAD(P)-binding domain-containing protein [Candidatus Limnocylindrales bacterium]
MTARSEMRVAIVGAGVMAEAMIAGLLADRAIGADQLVASHPRRERREALAEHHGIGVVARNTDAIRDADIVVLAVKP